MSDLLMGKGTLRTATPNSMERCSALFVWFLNFEIECHLVNEEMKGKETARQYLLCQVKLLIKLFHDTPVYSQSIPVSHSAAVFFVLTLSFFSLHTFTDGFGERDVAP